MASIWLNKNPEVSKVHHHFELQSPRSCQGEGEKLANARRMLAALKAKREELSSMSPDWEAKVVLFLTLTKETSYSFVDLAGSVAAIVMPKKMAKPIEAWSKGLKHVMDMTEAATDGKSASDLAKMGINMLNPKSVGGKTAKYKAEQGMALVDLQGAERRKHKQDIGTAQQDIVLGNTEFILDLSENELSEEGTRKVKLFKNAIAVFKSAERYNRRLTKAFNNYLEAGGDPIERGAEISKITREIMEVEKTFEKALIEFQSCLDRSDTSLPQKQKGTSKQETTWLNEMP